MKNPNTLPSNKVFFKYPNTIPGAISYHLLLYCFAKNIPA